MVLPRWEQRGLGAVVASVGGGGVSASSAAVRVPSGWKEGGVHPLTSAMEWRCRPIGKACPVSTACHRNACIFLHLHCVLRLRLAFPLRYIALC